MRFERGSDAADVLLRAIALGPDERHAVLELTQREFR
jgi:hypothetical protein